MFSNKSAVKGSARPEEDAASVWSGLSTALEKHCSHAWNEQSFRDMLNASMRFSSLDHDVRNNVTPALEIPEFEQLVSEIEQCLHNQNYTSAADGLIKGTVHYSHTGYLNQQLNFPLASAAVGAFWGAILNQGQAVFNMSPITSVIEKRMLDWAKKRLGFSEEAFGLSTGGGSLANLTALLAARNRLDQWRAWTHGGESELTLIVSKHAHYSMARAASIIGIGESNVCPLATDNQGRISLKALTEIIAEGRPCIVCLTAGTTSTGAFDDIAGFFKANPNLDRSKVWVHVDAAHGGSFYASKHLAKQFAALSQADSVCWDLHKVFFQSVPLSFLFFKDREAAGYASRHTTPYLSQELEGDYPDMHNWTLECSRSSNAIKLWMSLNTVGEATIVNDIQHLLRLTEAMHEGLTNNTRLQIYARPMSNILCFRVKANNEEVAQQLTHELFDRINDTGYWSVGHVYLDEIFHIKICCMNPRLTIDQVSDFVLEVDRRLRTLAAERLVNYEMGDRSPFLCEVVW